MSEESDDLLKKALKKVKNLDDSKIEAIVYALYEIEESMNKIYKQIIPSLVRGDLTSDEVQDFLWDIREEFRHIEYHIQDADI